MNDLIEQLEWRDHWLIEYLLGWWGLGPAQPWGAATSFAMEIAHGYGLIKSESDTTPTEKGEEVKAALRARTGDEG